MMVSLMNLGDAPRVVYNRKKEPIFIEIGHVVPADMGRRTLDGIMQHRDTETLIIAPAPSEEGDVTIPDELVKVLDILRIISFEEYSVLLAKINEVCPPLEATDQRPNRLQMRAKLKHVISTYINSDAHKERLIEMSRQFIKEEGDPAQLEKEQSGDQSKVKDDKAPTPERSPRSPRSKDK